MHSPRYHQTIKGGHSMLSDDYHIHVCFRCSLRQLSYLRTRTLPILQAFLPIRFACSIAAHTCCFSGLSGQLRCFGFHASENGVTLDLEEGDCSHLCSSFSCDHGYWSFGLLSLCRERIDMVFFFFYWKRSVLLQLFQDISATISFSSVEQALTVCREASLVYVAMFPRLYTRQYICMSFVFVPSV